MIELAEKYISDVLDGSRCAGELEILAVKRHIEDIKKSKKKTFEYVFMPEKTIIVFKFISLLKHYKGEWANQQFTLEPWQAFIVYCIFGWQKKKGGRRYTYVDIEVARKNGKTTFAAAISLAMLLIDGESGAEIYSAAVDKDQAKICWEAASEMAKKSPHISDHLKFYKNSIVLESSASFFKPLSKDSKNKDGLNPHVAICDERHAWKTNEIFEVLKSGMGARKQPMIISITTAGFDKDAPYFKDLKVMEQILRGYKSQDNWFIIIFQPDKDDDWQDEKTWIKANPNYGVSVSKDYFTKELEDALNKGGTTEVNFKTKNLNIWVDAPDTWIGEEIVRKNNKPYDMSCLIGKKCICGIDLASHSDFNAYGLFFPDEMVYYVRYFIPKGAVKDEYQEFIKEGEVILTDGDTIDIDFMVDYIIEDLQNYDLEKIAFDPYKAYHGVIQGLTNAGLGDYLIEYAQGISFTSEPMKLIEKIVREGGFNFLGNKTLMWNFRNIVIYTDAQGNIRPNKREIKRKIDGISALIMVVGIWMKPKEEKIAYKDRELRILSL